MAASAPKYAPLYASEYVTAPQPFQAYVPKNIHPDMNAKKYLPSTPHMYPTSNPPYLCFLSKWYPIPDKPSAPNAKG